MCYIPRRPKSLIPSPPLFFGFCTLPIQPFNPLALRRFHLSAAAEKTLTYIPIKAYGFGMELIEIYACLCDRTRLRLLHVLGAGPLCVCHFQAILREPQVKISKHLAYLRARGLVVARREGNWMIYALPEVRSPELRANLACLQDCVRESAVFRRDLLRRASLSPQTPRPGQCGGAAAPAPKLSRSRAKPCCP